MAGTEGLTEPVVIDTAPVDEPEVVETPAETPETPAAPKPGDPEFTRAVQKRINEITRKEKEATRRADTLQAELDAVKRKDAAGARPEPPDLGTLTNVEGQLDPVKYKQAMRAHEDALHTWREAQKAPTSTPPPPAGGEPDADLEIALAMFRERSAPLLAQHADFAEVIERPVFTPEMRGVLFDSEHGPAIAYHLGQNQTEAMRIGALPSAQMYREMGKLEAKLASGAPSTPAPRSVSGAPEPITPVNGTVASTKDLEKMSTAEWMAHEQARAAERLKANPMSR